MDSQLQDANGALLQNGDEVRVIIGGAFRNGKIHRCHSAGADVIIGSTGCWYIRKQCIWLCGVAA